jgi:RNA polymerase sigma-70 factor (ECF subfamily)
MLGWSAPICTANNVRIDGVALSDIDRNLLKRCLHQKPRAWEDFVDRFMGLIVHVVDHAARARSVRLTVEDRDDLCGEVFLSIIRDESGVLRRFRGQSSLATYITVIARRVVVKQILQRKASSSLGDASLSDAAEKSHNALEERIEDQKEVERLLGILPSTEAQVVRMYHIEGKTYFEISVAVGMSENSIGPLLSRARNRMRQAGLATG